MMAMLTAALAITGRGVVKTKRIPAILIQSVFFPVFFLVIYVGLYAGVLALGGFGTESVENWYLPFMMLQGAAFAGVAVGFSTAVDIDTGFFDRLLAAPVSRFSILLGTALVGVVRALIVATIVLGVGMGFGARFTGGVVGLLWLYVAVVGLCLVASGWALGLIYRFKDQRITPLFPIGIFLTLFMSTAQVPIDVATGWLKTVARINPVTQVLELARQAFLDDGVTADHTVGGLIALAAMVVTFGWFAWSGLRRFVP
jgi:ABC-2 type transport system permease protein